MKIEIVEFYPKVGKAFIGSMHIYVPHLDLDIRGVMVKPAKGKYYFVMPFNYYSDEETQKKGKYPVVGFGNRATYLALIDAINKEGNLYMDRIRNGT